MFDHHSLAERVRSVLLLVVVLGLVFVVVGTIAPTVMDSVDQVGAATAH